MPDRVKIELRFSESAQRMIELAAWLSYTENVEDNELEVPITLPLNVLLMELLPIGNRITTKLYVNYRSKSGRNFDCVRCLPEVLVL